MSCPPGHDTGRADEGDGVGTRGGVGTAAGRSARPARPVGGAAEPGLVAVVGARGGAGASTAAAAAALGLRGAGTRATLVDLDVPGAGLDVLLGVEAEPGARWPDLDGARGEVDGAGVLATLPRWRGVPVLSGSRLVPETPDPHVVVDVCAALARAGETLVLDLPGPAAWARSRPPVSGPPSTSPVAVAPPAPGVADAVRTLLAASDVALVVVPLDLPAVAGAVALLPALARAGARDARLVVRGPAPGRLAPEEVEAAVGVPLAAVGRADARLAGAVERGEGPPAGPRTPVGRLARDLGDVLAGVLTGARA